MDRAAFFNELGKIAALGDLGSQSARSRLNKPVSGLRQTMTDFASAPTQHMPAAKLPKASPSMPGIGGLRPGHLPAASQKLTSLVQKVRV